jgi:feruloyl esterase
MVPGMGHGPGTTGVENFNFDALGLIEQWKENGQAPDQLVVAHYKEGKQIGTRLVCQYPRVATYNGTGNVEESGSYSCK